MSDLESILSGEQPEPVAEVEAEPVAEEAEAPKEAEAEAAPAAEEQPAEKPVAEEAPAPEPQMIPVGVAQGLRDEIRALKAQLPKPAEAPAPDFYADPQAAVQHQVAPIQRQMMAQNLAVSRFHAEQQFGKETVDAAYEYFNQNPQESQDLLNHPSPFHAAVEAYNKGRVAKEIGNDPDAYRAKIEAEVRAEIEAEMVAKQAKEEAARVAPSMANVTGTGGGAPGWTGPADLGDLIG